MGTAECHQKSFHCHVFFFFFGRQQYLICPQVYDLSILRFHVTPQQCLAQIAHHGMGHKSNQIVVDYFYNFCATIASIDHADMIPFSIEDFVLGLVFPFPLAECRVPASTMNTSHQSEDLGRHQQDCSMFRDTCRRYLQQQGFTIISW